MSDYYIKTKGEERGPYAESQLRSMWGSGAITSDTLYRLSESQEWEPIGRFLDEEQSGTPPGAITIPATAELAGSAAPKKTQAGMVFVFIILLVVLGVMYFGNVHIITGGNLDSPRVVKKASWGLSETFVNIDTITSMPWFAAQSRYPLGCAVLERAGLIESDAEFRERKARGR